LSYDNLPKLLPIAESNFRVRFQMFWKNSQMLLRHYEDELLPTHKFASHLGKSCRERVKLSIAKVNGKCVNEVEEEFKLCDTHVERADPLLLWAYTYRNHYWIVL
jgi:hypothetical protein